MAVFQLSVEDASLPRFSRSYDLDGVTYALEFVWSERFSDWHVYLLDQEEQNVLAVDVMQLDKVMFQRQLPGFIELDAPGPLSGAMADLTTMAIWYTDQDGRREMLEAVQKVVAR